MRLFRAKAVVVAALLTALAVVPATATAGVSWMEHQAGLALGRKLGKPVLVSFFSTSCGFCVRMDASTYADPKIVNYLKRHFVTVRVVVDQDQSLARLYGVTALPSNAFLDTQGMTLTVLRGFIPPQPFFVVLNYIASGSYRTVKFRDYVQKNFPQLFKPRTQ